MTLLVFKSHQMLKWIAVIVAHFHFSNVKNAILKVFIITLINQYLISTFSQMRDFDSVNGFADSSGCMGHTMEKRL